MQVDLTWTAARTVLGLPLRELKHANVAVHDVWGAAGRRLIEQLAEEPTAQRRHGLVANFLLRRASPPPPSLITGAGATIDRPMTEDPGGHRAGWIIDPYGHRWNVSTRSAGADPLPDRVGDYDITRGS